MLYTIPILMTVDVPEESQAHDLVRMIDDMLDDGVIQDAIKERAADTVDDIEELDISTITVGAAIPTKEDHE